MDKLKEARMLVKDFTRHEHVDVGWSGGKDSVVLEQIFKIEKIPTHMYTLRYNVTTIDLPDVIKFIKTKKTVFWDYPEEPFLHRMVKKGFPCRPKNRWCCSHYKERTGAGKTTFLGVRKAESKSRESRKPIETCYLDSSKRYINPIINWTDDDVWNFIYNEKISYCRLYDEGFIRLGCWACPFANQKNRIMEIKKYPRFAKVWRMFMHRLYAEKTRKGHISHLRWKNGDEMCDWYFYGEVNPDGMFGEYDE